MEKLSALFYPYPTRNQIEAIKVASIYFDEVYVMSPISVIKEREFSDYYEHLSDDLIKNFGEDLGLGYAKPGALQHESVLASIDLLKKAEPVIDEGIVKIINPFDEMKSKTHSEDFEKIIKFRAREAHLSKFPPEMPNFGIVSSYRIRRDPRVETIELLEARTNAIKSIMYDAALLLSLNSKTIPITDTPFYDYQFALQATEGRFESSVDPFIEQIRIRRLSDKLGRHKKHRELQGYEISREAILSNVPCFERASFKDIVHLRNHCSDELSAFRIQMKKLATLISEGEIEKEIGAKISDIVSKEVTPVLNELEKKLKLSKSKWAKRILDRTTSIKTLATLASTIYVGMPLELSIIAALGISGLQAGAESFFEKRELRSSNGFSFLLELKKIAL